VSAGLAGQLTGCGGGTAMKRILIAVAALAVLGLVPGAAAATARAAVTSAGSPANAALVTTPDVVLINQPASRVCAGNRFTVGVWYQQFSGGSRAYRVLVYNPSGTLIFYRSGLASPTAVVQVPHCHLVPPLLKQAGSPAPSHVAHLWGVQPGNLRERDQVPLGLGGFDAWFRHGRPIDTGQHPDGVADLGAGHCR
jgi:hypothetical protein